MRSLAALAALVVLGAGLSLNAAWAGDNCAVEQAARKTGTLPSETHHALRIYDLRMGTASSSLLSYNGFINELADADVVFLGEQHDDPATHYMEWRVLRDLAARHNGRQALSLEMFERDTQRTLNAYLRGELSEEEFLAASRPWPNYPTDYRPMIELAKTQGLPVVAANIPRPLASRVAKQGLEPAQAGYSAEELLWSAASVTAPLDLYWELFYDTMGAMMGGHGGVGDAGQAAPAMPPATMGGKPAVEAPAPVFISEEVFRAPFTPGAAGVTLRSPFGPVLPSFPPGLEPGQEMVYQIYQAQCIKDDTMAESIARQRWIDPMRPVLHVNGSFHSDYHQGTVARLLMRRPSDRVLTVSFRSVTPLSSGDPASERLDTAQFSTQPELADFIVFVPAPAVKDTEPADEPAPAMPQPMDKGEIPAGV